MSEQAAQLLQARGNTHGEFSVNSAVTQDLKRTMRAAPNWNELTAFEAEALEMIAHKIGRILTGNPHLNDHWDDIEGYARLAAERVRKKSEEVAK